MESSGGFLYIIFYKRFSPLPVTEISRAVSVAGMIFLLAVFGLISFFFSMTGIFAALSRTPRTVAVAATAFAYIFALFFSAYQINYIKNDYCKNNG